MKRRWLIPEVIQTSAMDCGPANLKAILGGFGVHVSYGRLREACRTEVDGTSIDTLEDVAGSLGLDVCQQLSPPEHMVVAPADSLPCLTVVKLPGEGHHFVTVWRKHGPWLQVMDPAMGRRWVRASDFLRDLYIHSQELPADSWTEWAKGPGFLNPLRVRMRKTGLRRSCGERLIQSAVEQDGWRGIAALDAAVQLATALASPSLAELASSPELIPTEYWRVFGAGEENVTFSGAVILLCSGAKATDLASLPTSLRKCLSEPPVNPLRELGTTLFGGGHGSSRVLFAASLFAAFVSSCAVLVEALFLRALFNLTPHLTRVGERFAAVSILVLFLLIVAGMEWAMEDLARASGRQLEVGLRIRFCLKVPRLGDRYFQSRLISDMAQRAHAVQNLRTVPLLAATLFRSFGSMLATVVGIIWLFPEAAVPAVLCAAVSAGVPLLAQSGLVERDLRVRELSGSLSRFFLDALLGIVAVRTHGAGPVLRTAQGRQLASWAEAGLRLQRGVAQTGAVQMAASYGIAAWLVFAAMHRSSNTAALILLIYWALSLPETGREIAAVAWQWPALRNHLLRLIEPLGAPEEAAGEESPMNIAASGPVRGASIRMMYVDVAASGRPILQGLNLNIESGEHVAIVGVSGAGKSSLVGLLLGWYRPSAGELRVDGEPLTSARLQRLRAEIAWVDPQVHLWNESLLDNLSYGLPPDQPLNAARAIEEADLSRVIQALPDGMQTPLGEGGALLSGGEGQRVRMGRAYGKTGVRLAILDEPARGLDREMRERFLIRARHIWRDATLLCITHDVASTRVFDRVLVIEEGRILEDGDPAELYDNKHSRYRELCDREGEVRDKLWGSARWRRLRMDDGRLTEELEQMEVCA